MLNTANWNVSFKLLGRPCLDISDQELVAITNLLGYTKSDHSQKQKQLSFAKLEHINSIAEIRENDSLVQRGKVSHDILPVVLLVTRLSPSQINQCYSSCFFNSCGDQSYDCQDLTRLIEWLLF